MKLLHYFLVVKGLIAENSWKWGWAENIIQIAI